MFESSLLYLYSQLSLSALGSSASAKVLALLAFVGMFFFCGKKALKKAAVCFYGIGPTFLVIFDAPTLALFVFGLTLALAYQYPDSESSVRILVLLPPA